MLPILYHPDLVLDCTLNYTTNNSYGFFNHCTKCEVTKERNSEYSLEMELMPNDRLIDVIAPNLVIKAKADHDNQPQLFTINTVDIDTNLVSVIKATHIKSSFFNNWIVPNTLFPKTFSGTIYDVVEDIVTMGRLLRTFYDRDGQFHLYQDVEVIGFDSTEKTLTVDTSRPLTFEEIFLGDGGVIDTFGGEFKFDNEKIYLYKSRGVQTYKTIRFGSGISNFTQSMSNTECYQGVVGYATFSQTNTISGGANTDIYVESDIMRVDPDVNHLHYLSRNLFVDFNDKFNSDRYDATTEAGRNTIKARLNTLTEKYINTNNSKLSEVGVSITVNAQSELDKLQNVGLCDIVKVSYGAAGVNLLSNKITKTVYDSLAERYVEHQIGDRKLNLTDYLKKSSRR